MNREIFQEKMYAVDFGAVVPEVYYAFRGYAAMDIFVSNNEYRIRNPFFGERMTSPSKIVKSDVALIDRLLEFLSRYSTSSLLDAICSQDPWKNAYRWKLSSDMFCPSAEISNRAFRDYFWEDGAKAYLGDYFPNSP